jgi:hypothetical protein
LENKATLLNGYVSAEECLAAIFPTGGMCLRQFRKFQSQGFVPFLKLGRRTLFKPSEVLAALERNFKVQACT